MDRKYPLYVQNNSDHSIKVYFNDNSDYLALYPDTLLSGYTDRLREILIGENVSVAGGSASWKDVFKVTVPFDTLSLFVFHTDTLNKYSWAEVQTSYKILKRYDLSLEDLEHLDYKLSYPPDAKMSGVKMYPPYP